MNLHKMYLYMLDKYAYKIANEIFILFFQYNYFYVYNLNVQIILYFSQIRFYQ